MVEKWRSNEALLGDADTKLAPLSASWESKPSRIPALHHELGDVAAVTFPKMESK